MNIKSICHVSRRIDMLEPALLEEFYFLSIFQVKFDNVEIRTSFLQLGIGCFSNDITELIQFRKSLEAKVSLRTQELQKALEKEKELTAWKARFGSMVSHEFRMPLATIKNTVKYIQKYKQRMGPESLGDKIGIVDEQVDLMIRMLEDLLMLGKTHCFPAQP